MRSSSILTNRTATFLGRGLHHRNLDQDQLAELAASILSGERPFIPSAEQLCLIFRIPRYVLTKHRRKNSSGNGNGNGAAALQGGVEHQLVASPEKLTEVFTKIATELGVAKTLDILAAIERAQT
jgi:hypothetical protein